jgi:hypothetical protein
LTESDHGFKSITIATKYLKQYGRGSSLTITTVLTASATTETARVKLIRLHLV